MHCIFILFKRHNMKHIIYSLSFLIFPGILFAQVNDSNVSNGFSQLNNSSTFSMRFKTENKGNPYLYDTWKEGYYILNDTVVFTYEKMQVDLEKGLLVLGKEDGKAILIRDQNLTDFAISTEDNRGRHYFKRFDASRFEDTARTSHFYELVSAMGSTEYVLKEVEKYLFDPNISKGYQTQNNLPNEWKSYTYYYIENGDGIYVKTKLNKKSILKVLADQSSSIKSFVSEEKLSYSKEADVEKIMAYYHSL